MDPYLEDPRYWPAFQHQLITCLYQSLLPGLVDRYRARVGQRHYITEQPLFTSVAREEHREEYIEILQRKDGRLITLIDMVSPTNRTTDVGRQVYLHKRREARAAGANVVELDLVLQGQPIFEHTRSSPEPAYAIVVSRATRPDRTDIAEVTLQKELPRFKLPLAGDEHAILDLRAAFVRSYDQGGFAAKIDYGRDPSQQLSGLTRQWMDDLLKKKQLR
jgi:hypothetical protein